MVVRWELPDVILNFFILSPLFCVGALVVLAGTLWRVRNLAKSVKLKSVVVTLLLFYYLSILFVNIVGLPTLAEFNRVLGFGEALFNGQINYWPLVDGVSTEFVLNIFCFMPLGFLCGLLSPVYRKLRNIALLGFSISFLIEFAQLFTLFRVTDINDLIANFLGTIAGWLLLQLFTKIPVLQRLVADDSAKVAAATGPIPLLVVLAALCTTFFGG